MTSHGTPPASPAATAGCWSGWVGWVPAGCGWRLAVGARAWGWAGGRSDIRLTWHFWKRKNLLSQQTSTLCNDFCFSCLITRNGRGWRASSLDTWPHFRFCIFPASMLYFINRKAERGTLQEVETWAANEKVLNFCLLILLPWGSWLSWSVSQPLCPHVLSPEVSPTPRSNQVAGCNRAASALQPLQCRQLVPCGRVRGTGTCPRAVWRPSQIWVGLRAYTVVAFWTQMCDGNKLIVSANAWWRASRLYWGFLLPLLSGRHQRNSIQLHQLLANTAAATLKCAGQMHFAASYAPFFLLLQNNPAPWTILDTLVRLKLPSNDCVWESGSSWGTHCSLNDFCVPAAVLGYF